MIIDFILGLFIVYKSNKSFISLFYLLCVSLLFAFGAGNYILTFNTNSFIRFINSNLSLLLFSIIPFLFIHFLVLFLGGGKFLKYKIIIGIFYLLGVIIYFLILLKLLPMPVLNFSSISTSGYTFFVAWLAIFFSIGVSFVYSMLNTFSEKKAQSNFILAGLSSLILFLPGPFSEVFLHLVFKQNTDWYFFASIAMLVISIYFVFRNKTILTLYDSLRIALESLDDMMLRVNKEFQIVMVRGAFQKLSGFSESELVGLYLDQIIEQKNILKNYRIQVGEGKLKEANFDLTLIKKNRGFKYMNFSFTPIFNQGEVNGYVCLGRDISERRAVEEDLRKEHDSLELKIQKRTEELAKANEELQIDIAKRKNTEKELILARQKADEANRLKFSLLANLSHELRTPMIGILGLAEILKAESRSAEHTDYTNNIISSAQRLMTTLDKLMSLSQLESGSIELNNQRLNIEEVAKDELETFRQRAEEKNLNLIFKAKNNSGVQVFADERIFRQVIANLLDNAIKFTNKGGVIVETDSVIDKGNLWAFIRVIDTGIGISEKKVNLIFEEFRQGSEGNQRSFEGNGLGLALVKKMLEIVKGSITVESAEGKGSVFTVKYPGVLVNKEISELQNIKAAVNVMDEKTRANTLKEILFVEDNSIQAKLISKFLQDVVIVEFAEDSYSTIRKVKNKKYSAIFINIELGLGMNGIELMNELKEMPQCSKVPFIAVTKDLGNANRELIMKGFSSCLLKPFEKGELIKFVNNLIADNR